MLFFDFFSNIFSLDNKFLKLLLFYSFFFVGLFEFLTLFSVLIDNLIGIFYILLNWIDIEINCIHKIYFDLLFFWLYNAILVSNLFSLMSDLLSVLNCILFLFFQFISLLLLIFLFFFESVTYFNFSLDFFSSFLQLIMHSYNFYM